jgi:protein TonB
MGFRKNRSQHFWIFSSYSVIFHLVGFLALAILVGTNSHSSTPSTIIVRLVETQADISRIQEVPKPNKTQAIQSTLKKPEILTAVQKASTPLPEPFPDLFRMVRPADTSLAPTRQVEVGIQKPTPSITQVASLAMTHADPISQFDRVRDLSQSVTRILVDHKAGQSLTGTTPPKILFNPVPHYPRIAREMGLEGKTLLRVEILQDGRPGMVKVRESCGYKMLDEAATKAIKKWKFTPAQDGLFAVRSVVDLPIRFSLNTLG